MSKTIAISIDLSKVSKEHLYEDRTGRKWLDILVIETPNSQYGTPYMVTQGVGKEARAKGIKGAILGNGRFLEVTSSAQQENHSQSKKDDGVPF